MTIDRGMVVRKVLALLGDRAYESGRDNGTVAGLWVSLRLGISREEAERLVAGARGRGA